MIGATEIANGEARLTGTKLKPVDVSVLTSLLRDMTAGIEEKYSYQFESKLTALDDSLDSKKVAAQVAASLIELEALGFDGSALTGKSKSGLSYDSNIEFNKHLLFVFAKLYPIPIELSKFDLSRRETRVSSSINTTRTY